MMEHGPTDESLRAALQALAARDCDVARAYGACGLPPLRRREPDFGGLIRIIAAQQVSAQAASAIIARLDSALAPLTPEAVRDLDEDTARQIGFSRQKLRYARGLAEAVLAGDLDFARLAQAPDEAVMAELTACKGVGRWTAEIFLLFALQRPDVFPAQDLALQSAAQRLKGLPERPREPELRELAEGWRPYRSAAARFLWHLYRHPGAPEGRG